MPKFTPGLTRPCEYYTRAGPCGLGSYNGTCRTHRKRASMRPCDLCGRGTHSATGVCAGHANRQVTINQTRKRTEAREAAAAAELDRQLLELLG